MTAFTYTKNPLYLKYDQMFMLIIPFSGTFFNKPYFFQTNLKKGTIQHIKAFLTKVAINKIVVNIIFLAIAMRVEIHVKGNSTHLQVPPERTISWLI